MSNFTNDPETARKIAREVYISHYPLAMYYRSMHMQALDATTGAGMGKWLHLETSSPSDHTIVTPNYDTPYSYAWVDLRAEPWVVTLPKIEENRFYVSQWNDMWGFVIDNPGSVNDGNDGISVMLVSPTWQGEKPDGIDRIIRGESDFLGSLTRTQLLMPADVDMPKVKNIQASYGLQPLSAYLGQPAPAAAPEIDWPAWDEGAEQTPEFWNYVNFVLQYITPKPVDADLHKRAAQIGVVAGEKWTENGLDPAVRDAIIAGSKDAYGELQEAGNNIKNPETFFRTRADTQGGYFDRALGTYAGIFGNWGSISMYFSMSKDDQGELFDGGKSSYVLNMSKDQLPPVKFFWSLTMYSLPHRFLVANPLDRYAIGNATPGIKWGDDGSLKIYISKESPGKDKESNWLPSTDGPFWMVLRTYGPKESVVNHTWQKPVVSRA